MLYIHSWAALLPTCSVEHVYGIREQALAYPLQWSILYSSDTEALEELVGQYSGKECEMSAGRGLRTFGWILIAVGVFALVTYIVLGVSQPFQFSEFVRACVQVVGLFALGSSFLLRPKQPQRANHLVYLGAFCMFTSLILSMARDL